MFKHANVEGMKVSICCVVALVHVKTVNPDRIKTRIGKCKHGGESSLLFLDRSCCMLPVRHRAA